MTTTSLTTTSRRTTTQRPRSAMAAAATMTDTPTTKAPALTLFPASRNSRLSTKGERRRSLPIASPVATSVDTPNASGLSDQLPHLALSTLYERRQPSDTTLPRLTLTSSHSTSSGRGYDQTRDRSIAGTDDTISVHRLRSNSGLSLHTNAAALRRYTDYNPDGSTRLPPAEKIGDSIMRHGGRQIGPRTSSPDVGDLSAPAVPGLFSRETVRAVLDDPVVRQQLRQYARVTGGAENLDFLEKAEEYNKALQGVTELMANISTTFTSVTATKPIRLPPHLSKSLNADVKHISKSILPSLEMLFGEAGIHVEERIVREIYPAFAKRQLALRIKASLGAPSASAARRPFQFSGLGQAFCLTDPSRHENPIVYASDSFARVLGYARSEDIPRSGFWRVPKHSDEEGFMDEIVLTRHRRDNQPFWSYVSVCPLKSASGRVRFVLSGVVNISDVTKSPEDILHALTVEPPTAGGGCPGNPTSLSASSTTSTSTTSRLSPPMRSPLMSPLTSPSSSFPLSTEYTSAYKAMNGGLDRWDSSNADSHSNASQSTFTQATPDKRSSSKSFFHAFSRRRRVNDSAKSGGEMASSRPTTRSSFQSPPGLIPDPIQTGVMAPPVPQPDDSHSIYARFMVLQFLPGSSSGEDFPAAAPSTLSRRNSHQASHAAPPAAASSSVSRFKVAFSSLPMLELLGLGPAAQDAVMYHDVFSVLSELAGSPSITPLFRANVRQRIVSSESASLELSVPASGTPVPGAFSAGLGFGLAPSGHLQARSSESSGAGPSRRSSMFVPSRSKQEQHRDGLDDPMRDSKAAEGWWASSTSGRRRRSGSYDSPQVHEWRGRGPQKMQRLMSHWTPLKDIDGSVAWVILVMSPIVE